jgi:hypothetical protein
LAAVEFVAETFIITIAEVCGGGGNFLALIMLKSLKMHF